MVRVGMNAELRWREAGKAPLTVARQPQNRGGSGRIDRAVWRAAFGPSLAP